MRALLLSLALIGAGIGQAAAQPVPAQAEEAQSVPQDNGFEMGPPRDDRTRQRGPYDPFVWAGDECGASRYAHLVGEEIAHLDQAALPESAIVHLNTLTTLEYRPGKLNVVVNASGRIAAIGCF